MLKEQKRLDESYQIVRSLLQPGHFQCVVRYSSILAENTPEWLYFSSVGYHTIDHSFYSYFTSLSNLFLPVVFEYFTSYGLNPASEAQNIWFGW